ncbi:hypothetical protein ACEPAG_7229 [Sanghuangporus baumii]
MSLKRSNSSDITDRALKMPRTGEKLAYTHEKNTFDVVSGSGQSGRIVRALPRVLSSFSSFDVTGRILDKEALMTAHGGYCDIFIGHIHLESLPHRQILYGRKDGTVKIAIKRLRVQLQKDSKSEKTLAREIAVWASLNHPNILPFLGFILENGYPSLISEWMELGTVRKFLENHPDFDITDLVLGVAEG